MFTVSLLVLATQAVIPGMRTCQRFHCEHVDMAKMAKNNTLITHHSTQFLLALPDPFFSKVRADPHPQCCHTVYGHTYGTIYTCTPEAVKVDLAVG